MNAQRMRTMRPIETMLRAAGAGMGRDPSAVAAALGIIVLVVDPALVVGRVNTYCLDGARYIAVSSADHDTRGAVALGVGLALAAQTGAPPSMRSALARDVARVLSVASTKAAESTAA